MDVTAKFEMQAVVGEFLMLFSLASCCAQLGG